MVISRPTAVARRCRRPVCGADFEKVHSARPKCHVPFRHGWGESSRGLTCSSVSAAGHYGSSGAGVLYAPSGHKACAWAAAQSQQGDDASPHFALDGWRAVVGMGGKTTGKSYFKPVERDDLLRRRGETSTTARPPSEDTLAARTKPQRPVGWRDAVTQLSPSLTSFASLQVSQV